MTRNAFEFYREDEDFIDLQQYWLALKRRSLPALIVSISIFISAAFNTLRQEPVYRVEGKLLFKSDRVSALTALNSQMGEVAALTSKGGNALATQAQILRSRPIVEKTINKLNLKDKEGKTLKPSMLLSKLKVNSLGDTDILALAYESSDPRQAAAIINSLMKDYQENNITTNTAEARSARDFLNKQLPEVEKRLVKAEAQLRQFKEKNGVVALQEEAEVGVEALKELSEEIIKAQAYLAEVTTRSEGLQNQLQLDTQQAVAISKLNQSATVGEALAQYQKVQDELAVAKTQLTVDHPTVISLLGKEQALRKQLEKRVSQIVDNGESISERNLQIGDIEQTLTADLVKSEVERLAAASRVNILRKNFIIQQARLRSLPKLEQTQRQLERKLQVAQLTYTELLKKLQEVEVVENRNVGNARIISEASVPERPISPNIMRNLLLGGAGGIILGVATAVFLERMDKSLKTVDKIKQSLDYPLLGTIPKAKVPKGVTQNKELELPVLNKPYSPVTSAFEILQTNLAFTVYDKTLKVIVVTSSNPSEGKSFVCANLAVALSQLGRKVLLVDADMRYPRQNVIWEIPNLVGLSNVLVGQSKLQNTVQKALVTLDLLPVGKIPPNPLKLLESQRMSSLIKEAEAEYDYVIIDTPHLTAFADGLALSKLADGILMVVRPGVVDSDTAKIVKNRLKQSGQQVLGMVVNAVTPKNGSAYYYYGTGYYGETNKSKDKVEVSQVTKP